MTSKRKLTVLSIVLIISLLSSLFSQMVFAVTYNNENYTFANDCVINFAANGGVNQSELKIQSANFENIKNGLTFASVFPDFPQKDGAILKSCGYFKSDSSYLAVDKSSPINSYLDSMYLNVGGINTETKEITNATVYLGIDWTYEYSVNYELNGGVNSSANPYSYIYGIGVADFAKPSKDSAIFAGWYYNPEFTIPAASISSADYGNKTLYAKWEEPCGVLNFDSNTGVSGEITSVTVPLNSKISDYLTADAPSKDGYYFSGWVKQDLTELSDEDIMTADGFTVYALWTANEITAEEQIIRGSLNEAVPENSIIVENGTGEYTFSLSDDEVLPKGMTFGDNGTITGNFEEMGNFEINVIVTDKNTNAQTTAKIVFEVLRPVIQIKKKPVAASIAINTSLEHSGFIGGKFTGVSEDGTEEELDGELSWKDETTILSEYGNHLVPVIFTPYDKNYMPLEFEVYVNVKRPSGSSVSTITYTIRATASEGGTISPEGRSEIYEYGNQTYLMKANAGYVISEIIVDGENYDAGETESKYTFTSVTESHRIHVEFEKADEKNAKKRFYDVSDSDDDNTVSETSKKETSKITADTSNQIDVSSVFNTKDKIAYIQGYEDGSFRPSNSLTRAEAAVILSKILTTQMENKTYTSKFSDVNPSDWYGNYVCFLTEQGIIDGYTDGTFRPDASITRAELVALVAKALNIKDGLYTNYFSDTAGMWASNAISAINSFGWIKGYSDGTFRPDANITRAETTVFLNAVLGRNSSNSDITVSNAFNDIKPTDWFYESVIEAANLSVHSS